MADKSLNIKIRTPGSKKAKKDLGGIDGSLKSMGKSALKAGAAFYSVRGLITGLQKSIQLAGQFAAVESGFKSLAKQSGFSTQALSKLQRATDGTVSSMELMRQANNAMLLGIADSEDQMAQMFDIAQRLGSALGQDTTFAVESLVTGLGRQSKLMLDNLGIMVDANKANKDYAETLGISANQLTDQQRKQAFVNAAMASANTLVGKLGTESLTVTDHIAQMKAGVEELAITFGTEFGPAIVSATGNITKFIKKSNNLWKQFKLSLLGKENVKLLNELTAEARKVVDSGDLVTIEDNIKILSDLLKEVPNAGVVLIPAINELKDAAMELRKASVNTSRMIETMQLTADEARRFAEFTASAATSLATSAIMGDNVAEAFKRMLMQQILITAQMKIQKSIQEAMAAMQFATSGPMAFIGKGLKFLFGASPTQAAPSPNVIINQNFSGMGVIDQNFAANSIIPAINKAITTGQARITR